MLKKILLLALFNLGVCFADGNLNIWVTVHNNSSQTIWLTSEKNSRIPIAPGATLGKTWADGHYEAYSTEVHLWNGPNGQTRFCNSQYDISDSYYNYLLSDDGQGDQSWSKFNHYGNRYVPIDSDGDVDGSYFSSIVEGDGTLTCNFTTGDGAGLSARDDINIYSSIEVNDNK